jgi:hypothetical protein
MKKILIIHIYLISACIGFSLPVFEGSLKITKFNTTAIIFFPLENHELRIFEEYLGFGIDGLLNFFNNLYFRMEIAEIRKYEYMGDTKGVLLSNLALDLEYLLPIGWRFSPLVYLGTKYGPYDYRFPKDTLFQIVNNEFHWGLGAVYRLANKSKIILEFQIYSHNKWYFYGSDFFWYEAETWGIEKINLGFRYRLWDMEFK